MKLSKNGAGLLIFILSGLGIAITETQAIEIVAAIGQLISFGLMIWNQTQRPDVTGFLFKKE